MKAAAVLYAMGVTLVLIGLGLALSTRFRVRSASGWDERSAAPGILPKVAYLGLFTICDGAAMMVIAAATSD